MYHCDITWITPEQPSEDQQKIEHGPQSLHQQRQSREQEAVSADTRTHSHRPTQYQQQQKQHHHLSFVNLLVSDGRGQELRRTQLPFVRDFLASHHRDGNQITSEHTSGQLRSISLPGVLTPNQQSLLLSPLPTASSVSQSSQVGTSSATTLRIIITSPLWVGNSYQGANNHQKEQPKDSAIVSGGLRYGKQNKA
ncbi:hypothetical protein BDP55DRAFT_632328 [Colletotrichum godetiae]|uniref:Uncharacterized protein n=1 Tax=Colletotrichum godetiae TaxID=1209918 RepID=A0AAJ0AJQ2_9PEZI|nr:uncharacterized protein BDP55DRAFT_632328 [Colletotrichum godetiae]KAK1675154.1 hypothetical protein BDP55DRAFT_632328 [Colletotrichum godetiae]